jgi:perosamine synthetase
MMRLVPPAGAPLEIKWVIRALISTLLSNGGRAKPLSALEPYLHVRYVHGASSGRAALWIILRALQKLGPERSIVVIPAYTCFSVPAAVVRAGLKIYPVDVNPETLDFDYTQLAALPRERILCIVTSNLFGLMHDAEQLRRIAQARGAFIIDDAAQALGASRAGHAAGTLGDVGFFSFGRGKAMTTIQGGLIVTDSKAVDDQVREEIQDLSEPSTFYSAWMLLQMVAYSIFLNPYLYWIPDSIPMLKLGSTEYEPDFFIAGLPELTRALLRDLMKRLQAVNEVRRKNAAAIARALRGNPHFAMPRAASDCEPTYIRFPVLAKDPSTRDIAVSRLQQAGIGASPFYPKAICDIPGIATHMATQDYHRPQAEMLSQRLFTLPTHPLVRPSDLERMTETLSRI